MDNQPVPPNLCPACGDERPALHHVCRSCKDVELKQSWQTPHRSAASQLPARYRLWIVASALFLVAFVINELAQPLGSRAILAMIACFAGGIMALVFASLSDDKAPSEERATVWTFAAVDHEPEIQASATVALSGGWNGSGTRRYRSRVRTRADWSGAAVSRSVVGLLTDWLEQALAQQHDQQDLYSHDQLKFAARLTVSLLRLSDAGLIAIFVGDTVHWDRTSGSLHSAVEAGPLRVAALDRPPGAGLSVDERTFIERLSRAHTAAHKAAEGAEGGMSFVEREHAIEARAVELEGLITASASSHESHSDAGVDLRFELAGDEVHRGQSLRDAAHGPGSSDTVDLGVDQALVTRVLEKCLTSIHQLARSDSFSAFP